MLDKDTSIFAETELNETEWKREKFLGDFREWTRNHANLRGMPIAVDSFVLRYFRFQKFFWDKSVKAAERYAQMRTRQQDTWFQNLDVRHPKLRQLFEEGFLVVLPKRDKHGRRVIYSRISKLDPLKYTANDIMRLYFLVYETLLADERSQIRGVTYVVDFRDISFAHICMWTPSSLSHALSSSEASFPIRHKQIFLVHMPWTMNFIFKLAKSLLSAKIRKRIRICSDFEQLTNESESQFEFNADLLPEECGGKCAMTMSEMISLWLEELEMQRDFVLSLEKIHYIEDESKSEDQNPVTKSEVIRFTSSFDSGQQEEQDVEKMF